MSATNRGSKRINSDFYVTPQQSIEVLLDNIKHIANPFNPNYKILEPSAGDGAICKVLKHKLPYARVVANEIREEENRHLKTLANQVHNYDFLEYPSHYCDCDLIITNPPFSLAQEFIEKALSISKPNTYVIMLLRLAFLESKKRHAFWQKYPLSELYVLSQRPKFINNKSDATAYGWFVWNKTQVERNIVEGVYPKQQVIKVI